MDSEVERRLSKHVRVMQRVAAESDRRSRVHEARLNDACDAWRSIEDIERDEVAGAAVVTAAGAFGPAAVSDRGSAQTPPARHTRPCRARSGLPSRAFLSSFGSSSGSSYRRTNHAFSSEGTVMTTQNFTFLSASALSLTLPRKTQSGNGTTPPHAKAAVRAGKPFDTIKDGSAQFQSSMKGFNSSCLAIGANMKSVRAANPLRTETEELQFLPKEHEPRDPVFGRQPTDQGVQVHPFFNMQASGERVRLRMSNDFAPTSPLVSDIAGKALKDTVTSIARSTSFRSLSSDASKGLDEESITSSSGKLEVFADSRSTLAAAFHQQRPAISSPIPVARPRLNLKARGLAKPVTIVEGSIAKRRKKQNLFRGMPFMQLPSAVRARQADLLAQQKSTTTSPPTPPKRPPAAGDGPVLSDHSITSPQLSLPLSSSSVAESSLSPVATPQSLQQQSKARPTIPKLAFSGVKAWQTDPEAKASTPNELIPVISIVDETPERTSGHGPAPAVSRHVKPRDGRPTTEDTETDSDALSASREEVGLWAALEQEVDGLIASDGDQRPASAASDGAFVLDTSSNIPTSKRTRRAVATSSRPGSKQGAALMSPQQPGLSVRRGSMNSDSLGGRRGSLSPELSLTMASPRAFGTGPQNSSVPSSNSNKNGGNGTSNAGGGNSGSDGFTPSSVPVLSLAGDRQGKQVWNASKLDDTPPQRIILDLSHIANKAQQNQRERRVSAVPIPVSPPPGPLSQIQPPADSSPSKDSSFASSSASSAQSDDTESDSDHNNGEKRRRRRVEQRLQQRKSLQKRRKPADIRTSKLDSSVTEVSFSGQSLEETRSNIDLDFTVAIDNLLANGNALFKPKKQLDIESHNPYSPTASPRDGPDFDDHATVPFPVDASKITGIPSNVLPATVKSAVSEVVPVEFINYNTKKIKVIFSGADGARCEGKTPKGVPIPKNYGIEGAMLACTYRSETPGMRCLCIAEVLDLEKAKIKYKKAAVPSNSRGSVPSMAAARTSVLRSSPSQPQSSVTLSDTVLTATLQNHLKSCASRPTSPAASDQTRSFVPYDRLHVVPLMVMQYKVRSSSDVKKKGAANLSRTRPEALEHMLQRCREKMLAEEELSTALALAATARDEAEANAAMAIVAAKRSKNENMTCYEYTTTWRIPVRHLLLNAEHYVKLHQGLLHRLRYSEPVPLLKLLGSCELGSCTLEVMDHTTELPVTRHSFTFGYDIIALTT
ncbi:hypothetical protein DIPPA_04451 [Diplonema papillatum]|nr:hypothetical protein DIPPA_04451 [Diplonema papillatum]